MKNIKMASLKWKLYISACISSRKLALRQKVGEAFAVEATVCSNSCGSARLVRKRKERAVQVLIICFINARM